MSHLQRRWSTQSDVQGLDGALLAISWPPPARRSLLHYNRHSGQALVVEVDISIAQSAPSGAEAFFQPTVLPLSSLVAPGAGAWLFADWGSGFDQVLALPLTGMEGILAVVQAHAASQELRFRLLQPAGGRSRPQECLALAVQLEPLAAGRKASHMCLAETASNGLLLLRYCKDTGAASLHSVDPTDGGAKNGQPWSIRPLGSADLKPAREVTRILPVPERAINSATVLQYDDTGGNATVSRITWENTKTTVQVLWDTQWVPGYPNQHITRIGEWCCLVEYDPDQSVLNIGRFDDQGNYEPPLGDWWRCHMPSCKRLLAVWPPAGDVGAVALLGGLRDHLRGGEVDLAICALPIRPEEAEPRGPTHRFSSCWWLVGLSGPAVTELSTAVHEENWRHRRAAFLLAQRGKVREGCTETGLDTGEAGCRAPGTATISARPNNLPSFFRELSLADDGVWRHLVSML